MVPLHLLVGMLVLVAVATAEVGAVAVWGPTASVRYLAKRALGFRDLVVPFVTIPPV